MPSGMRMSGEVGSLGRSDLGSVSRDAVNDDRNPCKRAGIVPTIMAAISTRVWGSCRSCCSGVVSCEVGSFSGGHFRCVTDGQGCGVGNSSSVGVAVVSGTGVHRTDSHEAEERQLKHTYIER